MLGASVEEMWTGPGPSDPPAFEAPSSGHMVGTVPTNGGTRVFVNSSVELTLTQADGPRPLDQVGSHDPPWSSGRLVELGVVLRRFLRRRR